MHDESTDPGAPDAHADVPHVTVGTALSLGHQILIANYAVILGSSLLAILIQVVAGLITHPIDAAIVGQDAFIRPISYAAGILLQPLTIGPAMLAMLRYRDGVGDISTLFIGFTRYTTVVLIGLILSLGSMAIMLVVALLTGSPAGGALVVVLFIPAAIIMIYLGVRLGFAAMIAVDPRGPLPGPIDALRLSWRMTTGNAWTLFVIGLLLGLITLAGAFALLLPMLFYAIPLTMAAAGAVYTLLAYHAGLAPLADPGDEPSASPDDAGLVIPE